MPTEYTPCGKARHFNFTKFSVVVVAGCWISVSETAVSVPGLLPSLPLASLWLSLSLSMVRISEADDGFPAHLAIFLNTKFVKNVAYSHNS